MYLPQHLKHCVANRCTYTVAEATKNKNNIQWQVARVVSKCLLGLAFTFLLPKRYVTSLMFLNRNREFILHQWTLTPGWNPSNVPSVFIGEDWVTKLTEWKTMKPDETSFTGKANQKNKRGFKFHIKTWIILYQGVNVSLTSIRNMQIFMQILEQTVRTISSTINNFKRYLRKRRENNKIHVQCNRCVLKHVCTDLHTISPCRIHVGSKVVEVHNSQSHWCYSVHATSTDHILLIITVFWSINSSCNSYCQTVSTHAIHSA